MKAEDRIRLTHMLEAADAATDFCRGRARPDLDSDHQLVLALCKCIEIVGEAAGRVCEETRSELSQVPWRTLINMRNRLIHVYFKVNLDTVWQTVAEDLPPLAETLRQYLAR